MKSQKVNRAQNGKMINIAHGAMSNVGRSFNVSRKTRDTVSRATMGNIEKSCKYKESPGRVKPDYSGFDVNSYKEAVLPGGSVNKKRKDVVVLIERSNPGPKKHRVGTEMVVIGDLPGLYECDINLCKIYDEDMCEEDVVDSVDDKDEHVCVDDCDICDAPLFDVDLWELNQPGVGGPTSCAEYWGVCDECSGAINKLGVHMGTGASTCHDIICGVFVPRDKYVPEGHIDLDLEIQRLKENLVVVGEPLNVDELVDFIYNKVQELDVEGHSYADAKYRVFMFIEGFSVAYLVMDGKTFIKSRIPKRLEYYMYQTVKTGGNAALFGIGEDDLLWRYLPEGLREDIWYPEGGDSVRVHWGDSRLPEHGHIVKDDGVNIFASQAFVEGRCIDEYDVLSAVPALAVTNANYCDICGGVDVCRHILCDIVELKGLKFNLAVDLGVKASHELLRLACAPKFVALSSPHLRYVLVNMCLSVSQDPRLFFWKAAIERLVISVYPNFYLPQGFFSDVYDKVSGVIGVMWQILGTLPTRVAGIFSDMLKWLTSALRACVDKGISNCVDSLVTAIKTSITAELSGFWEKHKHLIVIFLKTIVRIAMDYTPVSILLEYLWDPYMAGVGMIASWFNPAIVAQAEEDMGLVVTTLVIALFVALGKNIPKMKTVSDTVTAMISAAAIYNRSQLWAHFTALGKWIKGGSDVAVVLENFRCRFPNTVDMIITHEEIVEISAGSESTSQLRTNLGYYYAGYLQERRKFGADRQQLEYLSGPALKFITATGINPIECIRRRPSVFMFHGASGLGKSRLISLIAQMLANKHKENYSPGGAFSLSNAVFNVNVGDAYCSGYDNQDIWLFDEWFQEKDMEQKPSLSINLLFTLVSTRPNKLNMAAVDDKGKVAMVSVVLGATNVQVGDPQLKQYIKSIHDPNAICTRINFRVRPVLKEGFSLINGRLHRDGVPLDEIVVHPRDVYNFIVTQTGDIVVPGDNADGSWSFAKLVNKIDEEYVACRDYVPDESSVDLSDFNGCSEFEPQGLFDFWKSPEVVQKYYTIAEESDSEGEKGEDSWCKMVELSSRVVIAEQSEPGSFTAYVASGVGDWTCWVDGQKTLMSRVWVCPAATYSYVDIALGLVMMSSVIVASTFIGKKIVGHVKDAAESANILVDGVKYWWSGEQLCYKPQAEVIVRDGVSYIRIHTKDGIKYYPQGEAGDMLKLLDNQRTLQQVPVISDSVFAVLRNGVCVGNAFAITDQRLVMPHHIYESVFRFPFVLANGKVAVELPPMSPSSGWSMTQVGTDCVVICLNAWRLNGIRNNLTKIAKKVPIAGLCRQIYRNSALEIELNDATFSCVDKAVEYEFRQEYKHAPKHVRHTNAPGRSGICGAIYIVLNEVQDDRVNGGVVIGYHLAVNETAAVRVFGSFDAVQWNLTSIASTCLPELETVQNGVGEFFGFESGSVPVPTPVRFSGRLGETNIPMEKSEDPYVIALLREFEIAGINVDPMTVGLQKLSAIAKTRGPVPDDLADVVDVVAERLVKHAILTKPNTAETFLGAGFLPSITRNAAMGPPLTKIGPTKDALCLTAEDLIALGLRDSVLPSPETLRMIEDLEDRIRSGYVFQNAAALSLKEEPRLLSKMQIGATRLFAGAPAHEFLLQRKFFHGVLATFLRKNLAVHSALGLDPADGNVIHELLLDGRIRPSIFSGDYKDYDKCFGPFFFVHVSRLIRSIALGRVVGQEIVDEDDYVRHVLLMRLAFNRLQLGKEIFEPKTGHPSGSALTTVLNIAANIILFTYGLAKMMNCSFAAVFDKVSMVFLGDDSHVVVDDGRAYDTQILVEAMAKCGFTITDCVKNEKPKWRDVFRSGNRSEYTFLGRHFTVADSVLEFVRVEKMLKFTEHHRLLETQPQAILSYREEIARWYRTGQFDWCDRIMPQLVYLGFENMEEFVSVPNDELTQILLNSYVRDPTKIVVNVPVYNRKQYKPQGLDGVPEVVDVVEDAKFMGPGGEVAESCDLNRDYVNDHMDLVNRVVDGVFSRPYVTEQGMIPTTDDTEFAELSVPSSYFYKNFNAQAKLANSVFMRCTFCCKLVVASGPFVTGKLLMSYRPRTTAGNIYEASADPCVEVDLSTANSGEIRFPTLLPLKWSLVEKFVDPVSNSAYTNGFDYGYISIWTLSLPSESVPYTLYTWLEDVQLRGVGYTDFTITPQGEKVRKECASAEVIRAKHDSEMEKMKWNWKVENTPGWLNKTAASVETIGGCVETLEESILGPLGDFVDKVGDSAVSGVGMALMGGCSVPAPNVNLEAFFTAPNWAQAHMYTNLPAIKLAVVQSQKIVLPREIFGAKCDEMNIRTFASRMGLIGKIPWDGTYVPGRNLVAFDVIPGLTPSVPVVGTEWEVSPPPVAYVCTMFRLHRGALRFRISIAKTALNTGTLEIVYQMGLNSSIPSIPSQDALCYRYIWDTTKSSSIEFEVPYIARTPWTQIYFERFGDKLNVSDVTTGRIYVNVVNPLMSSGGVVPSSINLLFYMAAGEDFEVAVPGKHYQFVQNEDPINPPTPPPGLLGKIVNKVESKEEQKQEYKPEGLFSDDQAVDGLNSGKIVLFREVLKTGLWGHMVSTGERVLSLRAIIKRFGVQTAIGGNDLFSLYHVYLSNFFMNTICRAFAFWSGGYRIMFHISIKDHDILDPLVPITYWLVWNFNGTDVNANIGAAHFTIDRSSNLKTIEVPWYSVRPFDYVINDSYSKLLGQPLSFSYYEAAAADDFQYGFQVGIPVMTFSTVKPPALY